ncbi:metallophosphatase family protein [Bacteroidia bacterium]|nr:metallophosphatase family protein [Bacteroidia bacterium]
MKRILLISDTHGYFGSEIQKHAEDCDEIWHSGDWGGIMVSDKLEKIKRTRGVYGNIDGLEIRKQYPKELFFEIEGLKVYIIHIGGYPGKYAKGVKNRLIELKPDLYICGHSHICKVMKDKNLGLVHFNSGAIGKSGFHKKRTMLKFGINDGKLIDINVLEYDKN